MLLVGVYLPKTPLSLTRMVKKLMRPRGSSISAVHQVFRASEWGRHQSFIAFSLMIAFLMIMDGIFFEHLPKGAFPKQDEP